MNDTIDDIFKEHFEQHAEDAAKEKESHQEDPLVETESVVEYVSHKESSNNLPISDKELSQLCSLWNNETRTEALKVRKTEDGSWLEEKFTQIARTYCQEKKSHSPHNESYGWEILPGVAATFNFGMSNIQDLLDNPEITDIHINSFENLIVKYANGERENLNRRVAKSNDELKRLVSVWIDRYSQGSERLDYKSPEANAVIAGGHRMHVVSYLVPNGESLVSIRRHNLALTSLAQMEKTGTFPAQIRDFLEKVIACKANCIISGATGSGKTTLLRCMLSEVSENDRILVCEDTPEIQLKKFAKGKNIGEMFSRNPNISGEGEFSLAQLVKASLRMDPDRIVVGEVRGGEAFPMVLAMSQGTEGSLSTMHAEDALSTMNRLASYISFAKESPPQEVAIQIARSAVDYVIFLKKLRGGKKILAEVAEVDRSAFSEGNVVNINRIVEFSDAKNAWIVNNPGIKDNLESLKAAGWNGWGVSEIPVL